MCEEMCITPGEDDDTSQAMDSDIKEIVNIMVRQHRKSGSRETACPD